jgi:hypothetical protein
MFNNSQRERVIQVNVQQEPERERVIQVNIQQEPERESYK